MSHTVQEENYIGLECASILHIWGDSVSYGGPQTMDKSRFQQGNQ